MLKKLPTGLFLLVAIFTCISINAQVISEYDQLVYVNPEWKNQTDVDPQLKKNAPRVLNEQQIVQFHLTETEKLLRKRSVSGLTPELQRARTKNLDVLHGYMMAGVFPQNNRHTARRQPYFIDDNNVYCAVGFLMKESGADDVARAIKKEQNYSFLANIHHEKLMAWVQQSGLTFDELALIQPGYGDEWPAALVEFHYNNTGADVNEYIELHQSSGMLIGMISFDTVRFYDGGGVLYKTLPILEMQHFTAGGHNFYHYQFTGGEHIADNGRIEISGRGFLPTSQLISTITYTGSSVQVQDTYVGNPTNRLFNTGESESTPANSSLSFCGFYYHPGWSLASGSTTSGIMNPCLVLPVSLSDFSYTVNEKKVLLNWKTASESNSKHFVIERSQDGTDFKAVDSVAAAGNSSVVKHYVFTDKRPGYVNHYRLKQVDLDGRSVYSNILYVKVDKASPLQLSENFVTTRLQYQLTTELSGSKLSVYDISGRNVHTSTAKGGTQYIDVSGWKAGKYIVRLLGTNGQVYADQFVKQ